MSFMDKLRKSVDEAVEKARPMVEDAVVKARPMVEDAAKKAKPMVENAVEKSKTALAENSDKVNSAIDVAAKQADKRTHGRYSGQISNLSKNAKREVGDLEKDDVAAQPPAPAGSAPVAGVPDADVVETDEPGAPRS